MILDCQTDFINRKQKCKYIRWGYFCLFSTIHRKATCYQQFDFLTYFARLYRKLSVDAELYSFRWNVAFFCCVHKYWSVVIMYTHRGWINSNLWHNLVRQDLDIKKGLQRRCYEQKGAKALADSNILAVFILLLLKLLLSWDGNCCPLPYTCPKSDNSYLHAYVSCFSDMIFHKITSEGEGVIILLKKSELQRIWVSSSWAHREFILGQMFEARLVL